MPKTKKPLAELGTVFVDGQSFYAHFQYNNDEGERKHIYGPHRDSKQDAQADLERIRTAGQLGDTREEGLSIMHAEAQRIMPRTKRPLAELGAVSADGRSFYAHIQYKNDEGVQKHIYGPHRDYKQDAQADLDQIRAAGQVGDTREEGLDIMCAEAQRLKISAFYEEEEIRAVEAEYAAQARRGSPTLSDEEPACDDSLLQDFENFNIKESEEVASTPPSQKPPMTPDEATEALKKFRPSRSKPKDLKHLLEMRADPNVAVRGSATATSLMNVMTFGMAEHVHEMRDLLLAFGATESADDKARWRICQAANLAEQRRMQDARGIEEMRGISEYE